MLIPDMPAAPPQSPSIIMVAQTNQARDSTKNAERVLGVCEVVANEKESYPNSFTNYIESAAMMYFVNYENRKELTYDDLDTAKSNILSQPKHGTFEKSTSGEYRYTVEVRYIGKDSAEVLVEIKGMKVKVRYFIHVTEYSEPNPYETYCAKGGQWKISLDAKGNQVLTAVKFSGSGLATWHQKSGDMIKGGSA